MMAVGGIPQAVQYAHLSFPLPLWWNDCQFPLFLCFLVGSAIVGWAAKGADEHSTLPQTEAATEQAKVQQAALDADAAAKPAAPSKVIVEPPTKP